MSVLSKDPFFAVAHFIPLSSGQSWVPWKIHSRDSCTAACGKCPLIVKIYIKWFAGIERELHLLSKDRIPSCAVHLVGPALRIARAKLTAGALFCTKPGFRLKSPW